MAMDYWILIKAENFTLILNLQKKRNLSLVKGQPLYEGQFLEKGKKKNKIRERSIFYKRCVVKLYFRHYVQENMNKVPVKLIIIT